MINFKSVLLSLLLAVMALTADAQSVVTVAIRQHAPLTATASEATVDIPQGGLTIGSSLSVSGGDGSYQYQWTDSTGTVLGTASTLHITEGGDYLLRVTDGEGCAVSVKFSARAATGISLVSSGVSMECVGGTLRIQADEPLKAVRVISVGGSLVKAAGRYTTGVANDTQYSISLADVAPGVYVVAAIKARGGAIVRRITLKD